VCQAKKYWQHTGEIISSRLAEDALIQLGVQPLHITPKFCNEGKKHSLSEQLTASASASGKFKQENDVTVTAAEIDALEPRTPLTELGASALRTVEQRICDILQEPTAPGGADEAGSVTICVSGMASIFAALRCTMELNKLQGEVVVFGFPYLDTLKVSEESVDRFVFP
jgi:hypothetical protein